MSVCLCVCVCVCARPRARVCVCVCVGGGGRDAVQPSFTSRQVKNLAIELKYFVKINLLNEKITSIFLQNLDM